MTDGRRRPVTETSLLGPFYRQNSPELALGESIARQAGPEEICYFGRVLDADGAPVGGATVEVWQTDPDAPTTCRRTSPA